MAVQVAGSQNLSDALGAVVLIDSLKRLQQTLKAAFKDDELDGGWQAALKHPLYIEAQEHIDSLHEQLKGLI